MGLLAKLNPFTRSTSPPVPNGIRYPDETWLHEAVLSREFTPDLHILQQKAKHLLFVYDNVPGVGLNQHLDDPALATNEMSAFTLGTFSLWKKSLGVHSYPIALKSEVERGKYSKCPAARIRGELYLVNPNVFVTLDTQARNGVEFTRKKVKTYIPYRYSWSQTLGQMPFMERMFPVEAWMYVGNPEFWDQQLDGGYHFQPVKMYAPNRPWHKPYYSFTPQELES
jgi:hypothetical protein